MNESDVINWLAGLFNEDPASITSDTPRDAIPEWDSLGVLNLMAEMDEKFGIVLSDEDLESINGVGDVIRILKAQGKVG